MEHSILVYVEGEAQGKAGQVNMYVCPMKLKAHIGDTIRWLYNDLGEFSCHFVNGSPFKGHATVRGKNGHTVYLAIDNGTGRYHYIVNEGQSTLDPIIIVDPSQ